MAIRVQGTVVIDDSRNIANVSTLSAQRNSLTVSNLGTLTTGTTTINLSTAQIFTANIASSNTVTLAFSNVPSSGLTQTSALRLTNGGSGTVVWPANTKFPGNTAPTLTTSGVDVLTIYYDTITSTYMVFTSGLDVK